MPDSQDMLRLPVDPESSDTVDSFALAPEVAHNRYSKHSELLHQQSVQDIIKRQDKTGEWLDPDVHERMSRIDSLRNLMQVRRNASDVEDLEHKKVA